MLAGASESATAADLIVLTNQGATPGVTELGNAFARASGHKVTVIQPNAAELERRVTSGPADLITGNPEPIAKLAKDGKVAADTVTPFVWAGLGLAVRAGAPKPDIGTVEFVQGGAAWPRNRSAIPSAAAAPTSAKASASWASPRP